MKNKSTMIDYKYFSNYKPSDLCRVFLFTILHGGHVFVDYIANR